MLHLPRLTRAKENTTVTPSKRRKLEVLNVQHTFNQLSPITIHTLAFNGLRQLPPLIGPLFFEVLVPGGPLVPTFRPWVKSLLFIIEGLFFVLKSNCCLLMPHQGAMSGFTFSPQKIKVPRQSFRWYLWKPPIQHALVCPF